MNITSKEHSFGGTFNGGTKDAAQMDLETENRIASILLREAAELRRQAEKEGVRAYLQKPNVRHRPNSRFLTATVLGVQQANKAVEVNEMWRLRNKELELDERLRGKSREESSSGQAEQNASNSMRDFDKRYDPADENVASSSSSSRRTSKRWHSEVDEGLRDKEVENFLQSRIKRGRGSVGSRMDETGPYLPVSDNATTEEPSRNHDTRGGQVVLGPQRPPSVRRDSDSSSEEEHHERAHKRPKDHSETPKKKHSKKHKSKDKRREKKKRRKRDKS